MMNVGKFSKRDVMADRRNAGQFVEAKNEENIIILAGKQMKFRYCEMGVFVLNF
jgi:hypothetical protein